MAFITRCYRNIADRLLRTLGVLLLVALTAAAHAGSIEPKRGTLVAGEDGSTLLSGEFVIDLGPRLEEAVSRGVPLYFNFEFELTRSRWWWSNELVATRTATYRLAYTALTRQYRLTTGNLHRNFSTLDEALRVLSRFVDLQIAERGVLKIGETYAAGMRMTLDRNQLPKPLQVDAIANRDWQMESRVMRWNYVATPPSPAPQSAPTGEFKP